LWERLTAAGGVVVVVAKLASVGMHGTLTTYECSHRTLPRQVFLPKRVTVKVTHDANGFAAEVMELPHCYTQAESFEDLVTMVNDAIFTYLDIPTTLIGTVAIFLPAGLIEEAKRQHLQAALHALATEDGSKRSEATSRSRDLTNSPRKTSGLRRRAGKPNQADRRRDLTQSRRPA
jgi:hypothetical protein